MKNYLYTLIFLFSLALNAQSIEKLWFQADSVHILGDREASIEYFLNAEQVLVKDSLQNLKLLAENNNRLGLRYQNYGHWDLSAFTYTKGLEQIDACTECDSIESNLLLNLGLLYVKLGMPESDYYLQKAKQIAEKSNVERVLYVYYKVVEGKLDEGVKYAKENQNNKYLSNYYYLKGRFDDFKYFDSSRVVLPSIYEAPLQNFQYHIFLADYYFEEWDEDSMRYHLINASLVAPILNDNEVREHLSKMYSQYFLKLGKVDSVLYYGHKSDSIQCKSSKNLDISCLKLSYTLSICKL